MGRRRSHVAETARAMRRAALAARCLAGDPIAAGLLASALAATPTPTRAVARPIADDLLSVRLAAEHGMSLQEFLALDAMDLIDLLWPDQSAQAPPTDEVGLGSSARDDAPVAAARPCSRTMP
jgi:hypothetical protein